MRKISFIYLSVCLSLVACNDDFLDRYPQTSIAPEAFFNTEEDLDLYVNGLVSYPDRYSYAGDQNTDNAATTGSVELKIIMTGAPTAHNITSGWNWGRLRDINYFLENYRRAATTSDTKAHYEGLAKYYRAEFYMAMVKRYSDVPWFSKTLNPTDPELFKARDPRAVVVDSIMADLEYASSNMRERVALGTPGKWAAKMMYAQIALYEGTYRKYHPELNLEGTANRFLQKAADVAAEIMASGKFSVHTTGMPNQDYAALFSSQDLVANKEVILANIFDLAKYRGQDPNQNIFGEYEQSPSRDLVQTYLMKDGSRYTDIAGFEKKEFVGEFENRDPRLSQTIVFPGWVRQPDGIPYVQRLNRNFTGYHQLKGYINTGDVNERQGIDYPVYRYADALLIYAEALAELGTLTQADLDQSINLLRARVAMPHLNLAAANASVDPFLAKKHANVSGPNKGVILEIRRERRVEFAFERSRYDDLMRWQDGKVVTSIPEGMYFPGLGKYDLTGDGIEDIILIDKSASIPADGQKIKNSLGVMLVYYKAGSYGEDVTVYLKGGLAGGPIVTEVTARKFEVPKFYYRPIPHQQTLLNPSLKQIFGW